MIEKDPNWNKIAVHLSFYHPTLGRIRQDGSEAVPRVVKSAEAGSKAGFQFLGDNRGNEPELVFAVGNHMRSICQSDKPNLHVGFEDDGFTFRTRGNMKIQRIGVIVGAAPIRECQEFYFLLRGSCDRHEKKELDWNLLFFAACDRLASCSELPHPITTKRLVRPRAEINIPKSLWPGAAAGG